MRAMQIKGDFHTCEGCDNLDGDRKHRKVRKGNLDIIEGWRDEDGAWVADADDYDDKYDAAEANDWDEDTLSDASYLECPSYKHDSDDGWEMEAFDVIHICGVCTTQYLTLDQAADCCSDEEK
jgi:hypothetical protein